MMTIIVGTNRPDSKTKLIAQQVGSLYAQQGQTVRELDLANLPVELFHPASYGRKPPAFDLFSETILNSSGLVIVTPEYNGGPPGILKYFIDMLPFPESFDRRPVCFIGLAAGRFGALRPVEQLQQIFGYRNAFIYPERVFIAEVHKVLDSHGLINDPELVKRLQAQVLGFCEFVKRQTTVPFVEEEH